MEKKAKIFYPFIYNIVNLENKTPKNYTLSNYCAKANVGKSNPHLFRAMTSESRRSTHEQIINFIHVRSRFLSHAQFPFLVDNRSTIEPSHRDNAKSDILNNDQCNQNTINTENQPSLFDNYRPTALFRTLQSDILKIDTTQSNNNPPLPSPPYTKEELQQINAETPNIDFHKQILNNSSLNLCIKNNLLLTGSNKNSNMFTTPSIKENTSSNWENIELNPIPALPNYVDNSPAIGCKNSSNSMFIRLQQQQHSVVPNSTK